MTAEVRSLALGGWEEGEACVRRHDVVLFEVMTDTLKRDWWFHYRGELKKRFRQDTIFVRAIDAAVLLRTSTSCRTVR